MSIQKVSSFQDEGGKLKAVASGALPNGKPVVVNADGTVSVVEESSGTEGVGSAYTFASVGTINPASVYVPTAKKIVIVYRDVDNSQYGTAVVGTVSGSTISFGSPVVFASVTAVHNNITYDAANDKIVISFVESNTQTLAVVGSVSGTSISFGTPVQIKNVRTDWPFITYDSINEKVVVVYQDYTNAYRGCAVVGTVSGTSISFGSEVIFDSARVNYNRPAFHENSGKVIVCYAKDPTASNDGGYVVGTVSGTSISFTSPATFTTDGVRYLSTPAIDQVNNKIVVAYQNDSDARDGYAIAGEISGSGAITWGSQLEITTFSTQYFDCAFHAAAGKYVIMYEDETAAPDVHRYAIASVSGTSLSYETTEGLLVSDVSYASLVYDETNQIVVAIYRQASTGQSKTIQVNYTSTNLTATNYIGISTDGAVADTGSATVDIIGSMNDAQTGLTAGQAYYVQTDGTLSTTADDPSVFAGTAINGTTILVKS